MRRFDTAAFLGGIMLLLASTSGHAATYIAVSQAPLTGSAPYGYFSPDVIPAMVQSWDGSGFTASTSVTIPTGTIVGPGPQWDRPVGIFLADSANSHRYIIGLYPGRFGNANHQGKGMVYWENASGMQIGYQNINAAPAAASIEIKVNFNSVTKVLDVDYRLPGQVAFSDLLTHNAPANFSPNFIGISTALLSSFATPSNPVGPWAPVGGNAIRFADFNITGGTGAAVSDNFDSLAFTSANWDIFGGKLQFENKTTFTHILPEPTSLGSLSVGLMALVRRRNRRY